MKKITIAVGSKRGPKLSAVTEALQVFSAGLAHDAQFEVLGVEVESGVSHTPASRDELMRGARQRAEALVEKARQDGAAWQYFVGLEGGLDVVHEGASTDKMIRHPGLQQNEHRRVFLESWAYVSNRRSARLLRPLRRDRDSGAPRPRSSRKWPGACRSDRPLCGRRGDP